MDSSHPGDVHHRRQSVPRTGVPSLPGRLRKRHSGDRCREGTSSPSGSSRAAGDHEPRVRTDHAAHRSDARSVAHRVRGTTQPPPHRGGVQDQHGRHEDRPQVYLQDHDHHCGSPAERPGCADVPELRPPSRSSHTHEDLHEYGIGPREQESTPVHAEEIQHHPRRAARVGMEEMSRPQGAGVSQYRRQFHAGFARAPRFRSVQEQEGRLDHEPGSGQRQSHGDAYRGDDILDHVHAPRSQSVRAGRDTHSVLRTARADGPRIAPSEKFHGDEIVQTHRRGSPRSSAISETDGSQ
mmetsp:Transcript_52194/g.156652  ORF Transcript_52194/g.156652 Transcript_52194/m.156652 type:complete len:295 (-) Transcript_52194:1618-2502(-)